MITYSQYKRLNPKQLIEMLLRYHHHFLAKQVSNMLGIEDKSMIFEDWAIKKIKVIYHKK